MAPRSSAVVMGSWRQLSRPVQMCVVAAFVLCAIPPATNLSPGPAGYVLNLVVLAVVSVGLFAGGQSATSLPRGELRASGALFVWLGLGVLRTGGLWETALAAFVLALLAAVGPWAMSRRLAPPDLRRTMVLMCGAAVIGSAVAAWLVPLVLGQGLTLRPGLPIGGASNNAVGLTLAMAGTLVGARLWPDHRWTWRLLVLVAGVLMLQSVSRAAWIMALVVLIAGAVLHRRWDLRAVSAIGASAAAVVLLGLIRLRGSRGLVDSARWDNVARGLEAWSDSPVSMVFGLGPLQMWPWLDLERGWAAAGVRGSMQYDTPWGAGLYHAHSTYLSVLVEHGIIGLLALLVVLGLVVRRCVREIRERGDLALVAVAVLLALPAMLVELYLLRGFPTAFLWWTAALSVGRGRWLRGSPLAPQPASESRSSRYCP